MTTRAEDKAYCLLGLLDVNMPMLYGEGMKAFHRLQLELSARRATKESFAWDPLSILERSLLVIQPFSGAVLKWSSWILTDASNLLKMTFQEKSCT